MVFTRHERALVVMSAYIAFDLFHYAFKERIRIGAERIDERLMV
jgi:hypothetical protein